MKRTYKFQKIKMYKMYILLFIKYCKKKKKKKKIVFISKYILLKKSLYKLIYLI